MRRFLAAMADEVDGSVPLEDGPPIWEPLPPQPKRGIFHPDGSGRIVSPQEAAYDSLADELFFGGAGGGGKTDLLLGLSLTKHRRSIIFRREFAQFRGAEGMIERSRQIIGLRGRLAEGKVWRDLPGARALEFGGVEHDHDKDKYKGRPHDLKGFDELPEFTEGVYRFLIAWLRTSVIGQRTRVVGTGNPPTTIEGQWVIKYWGPWLDPAHPKPAKAGELRWYAAINGKDVELESGDPFTIEEEGKPRVVRPRSRTFIPAAVEDNPYYVRTGYMDVLDSLPEPLRSQMRFGNFQASSPDDQWQVIPTAWVLRAQERWREDGRGKTLTGVGVDPSRGGKAEFAIGLCYDAWVDLKVHQATEAPDGFAGANLVFSAVQAAGGDLTTPVQIDIIGTAGSSVYDQARALKLSVVDMNGSERSEARDRSGKLGFFNQRSEWHWRLREILDPKSGQDIALPPDPQLRSDLVAPRWKPTPRGIQVESKDDIVARLGRSPDRGEAVIYAVVRKHGKASSVLTSLTW
jgi:hypothetical protein